MKTYIIYDKIKYHLSNENLQINDKVYPIARGRCQEDIWVLLKYDFREFMSGFPDDPHIIKDLNYSDYKPEQIRTDKGFGPIETYYKIIKTDNL
jgi:hypothetical protein